LTLGNDVFRSDFVIEVAAIKGWGRVFPGAFSRRFSGLKTVSTSPVWGVAGGPLFPSSSRRSRARFVLCGQGLAEVFFVERQQLI
jgi:hypothetical protein